MDKQLTGLDEYVATPTEMRLLEVMSSPDNRGLNITEKCQLADISRQTYYNLFKKPEFVKYYNEFLLGVVKSKMDDIIKATIHFAETEPRAHADRKILLEMGKLYFQKQGIEHSGNVVVINDDLDNNKDDENH